VEEPAAAYAQAMPQAARNACDAALALPLERIAEHLKGLGKA